MVKSTPFLVSNSITDFSPFFFPLDYLFKMLKATGIDGIELVIGFKSRWSAKRIQYLSEKYELPIVSLHQPPWSGIGLWFDEGFADLANTFGVKKITCHPLSGIPFDHPSMQAYLQKLSRLQEKKGVEILLENLPPKLLGIDTDTGDIEALIKVVEKFGFKITLDLDHMKVGAPHKAPWFPKLLPHLGNIHMSSFTKKHNHMPLYLGDLQTSDFIQALYEEDYKGLLTLELQYPHLITFFNYDFEMVKKSVELVKSL